MMHGRKNIKLNKPYVYLCLFPMFSFCVFQYTSLGFWRVLAVSAMREVTGGIKMWRSDLSGAASELFDNSNVFESYRMTFNGLTFCKIFTDFRFSRGVLDSNTREKRAMTVTQFICSPWP